jgi:hypothetical protein
MVNRHSVPEEQALDHIQCLSILMMSKAVDATKARANLVMDTQRCISIDKVGVVKSKLRCLRGRKTSVEGPLAMGFDERLEQLNSSTSMSMPYTLKPSPHKRHESAGYRLQGDQTQCE